MFKTFKVNKFASKLIVLFLSLSCIIGLLITADDPSSASIKAKEVESNNVCQSTDKGCPTETNDGQVPEFAASSPSSYFSELETYLTTHFKPHTLPNNSIYIGQSTVTDDGSHKFHGLGQWRTSHEVYTGSFVNGFKEGFGKTIQSKGDSIEGQWVHGELHGKAIHLKTEGNNHVNFTGTFSHNTAHGYGIYEDNFASYHGEWKHNYMDGNGTFHSKLHNYTYVGEYKNSLFSGHGVFKGQKYTYNGAYQADKQHGLGTLQRFVVGDEHDYVGMFMNGEKHGWGYMKHYAHKLEFEGHFVRDNATYVGRVRHFNGIVQDRCLDESKEREDEEYSVLLRSGETLNFGLSRNLKCQAFQHMNDMVMLEGEAASM